MGELALIMGFVIGFGLLVVVPVVAIVSESKRKAGAAAPPEKGSSDLQRRVGRMEAIVAAQQKQIEDLKEQLHVNILKAEDISGLQQRIGDKPDG